MCLNRISQIKDTNNQLIARYDYDIWDNRIAKTTYKDGQATTTYYFYNQDGLLAETNAQGLVMTQYGFAPSDSWQTSPLFIKTDKGYAYYHNDQLGTPRLATDKNGNVVWQADYATNGEATLSSNNQITSNLRFPGQYFDAESNLHYNTRRYYDPKIGRYITQDPIGYSGGLNLYRYANGNPINRIDPTGEIVPAIILGVRIVATEAAIMYGRCVANCMATQAISNAIGVCDDGDCFKDCLNPLNWTRKTPKVPRAKPRNVAPPTRTDKGLANKPKGITNPEVGKIPKPSTPNGMTNREFNEDVIKWGQGPNEARDRINNLTKADVDEMVSKGLTKEMAQEWKNFYENVYARDANNLSAKERIELMNKIIGHMD